MKIRLLTSGLYLSFLFLHLLFDFMEDMPMLGVFALFSFVVVGGGFVIAMIRGKKKELVKFL